MSRIRLAVALALAAAGTPAHGFVRETTTPYHPENGLCLWWADRQVTFHVNATSAAVYGTPPCGDAAAAEALAYASVPTWNTATRTGDAHPCTDLTYVAAAPMTLTVIGWDGVNLVVFRSGQCSDLPDTDPCRSSPGACAAKYDCWEHDIGTIALTTTTFDASSGRIIDSDVELNGWDGNTSHNAFSQYLTCVSGVPACTRPLETGCVNEDVGSIVTHEAGHMLGLDHTCQYPAPYDSCTPPGLGSHTMDPYGILGDTGKRVLSQDDVAGVCAVYPAGGPTATCETQQRRSGGCGTGGGAGAAALLLLVAPLVRRMLRK